ncbi:MAG: putative Ribokinase [Candidatus Doudnabacteria bacterium]|nr:putative Ribokinase [Candidatus Doudnabacteria bacterium]
MPNQKPGAQTSPKASQKIRKTKYDIIGIGDCTIDNFIEVKEATVTCDLKHEHCQLGFRFGDKIPYESLTILSAGNANNASVGMSRLGMRTAFYGTVGNDEYGQVILKALKKDKVDTKLVSVQKGQTNSHYVLVYNHDRTILIKHQAYKYKLPKEAADTKWIYFSSVGEKGLELHPQVVKMLEKNPNIKMSFNPGTFQLRLGMKKLAPLMQHAEVLCLNKEEAQGLVGGDLDDIRGLAEKLHQAGPKIVVITDALNGSYCLDGGVLYKMGVYPHKPIESTGAGDAYATGFAAAKMLGLPTVEALRWGSRNGANVATEVGPQAGLVSKKQMLTDLAKHPEVKATIIK